MLAVSFKPSVSEYDTAINSPLEMTKCASIQVVIPQVPSMAPVPTPKISALDASFLVGQRLITKQISV